MPENQNVFLTATDSSSPVPGTQARETLRQSREIREFEARQAASLARAREHIFRRNVLRMPPLRSRGIDIAPPTTPEIASIKSDDNGDYIKSKRTFGVEYEINFSWNDVNALRELIGQSYNIVPDGSVRAGLEIVSPILGGQAGEKEVLKVCKAVNDLGGGADETCGLHIHFGAKDFFKKETVEVWTFEHAVKYVSENKAHKKTFFVLHNTALERLNKQNPDVTNKILRKQSLSFFEWEGIQTEMERMSSVSIMAPEQMYGTLLNFYVKVQYNTKTQNKIKQISYKSIPGYKGRIAYCHETNNFIVDKNYNKNLRVLVLKRGKDDQKSLERLKRLAAFYVVFDDIIMSMLPQDRRENDYTRRTGHRMSIEDILAARTVTEFMKGWFKFTDDTQVTHARGNGGNGAVRGRYCGLNLYSLFNIGTVEIRYLGGTIDPQRILFWANLHQTIIDLAADTENHRLSVKSLQKAALIVDLDKRKELFFKKLKLPSDTERYWRDEIENHRDDDKIIFDECIEEDAAEQKNIPELSDDALEAVMRELETFND